MKFLARSTDWEELDANDSRKMADLAKGGALVVGGSEDHPNGHVLVVYPGDVKESSAYAYSYNGKMQIMRSHGLYARFMSRALGDWPGAKSDGDKDRVGCLGGAEVRQGALLGAHVYQAAEITDRVFRSRKKKSRRYGLAPPAGSHACFESLKRLTRLSRRPR